MAFVKVGVIAVADTLDDITVLERAKVVMKRKQIGALLSGK